jgi:hypothetical protein
LRSMSTRQEGKSVALTRTNPDILFVVFILGSPDAHLQASAVYKHRAAWLTRKTGSREIGNVAIGRFRSKLFRERSMSEIAI